MSGGSPTAIDDQLMVRAQGGDVLAFEDLVRRTTPLVEHVARRIAGDLASDVGQHVFLSAWLGRASYDPSRASATTWLCGIARNRAVDALRRTRRHLHSVPVADVQDELVSPDAGPDEAVLRASEAAEVRRALCTLSPEQRTVLTLAYFGGLTQSEIGEKTDAPLGTVKSRTRLGLDALRAQLADAA